METIQRIEPDLLQRIVDLAGSRHAAVAALSIDEIAAGLGISRMTLYRRIGSRKALHFSLRDLGYDPGEEPGAAERALIAAADLIREAGVAALTLEAVATRAQCALPTIYTRFGGRSGLLMAVFERYSPVLMVKGALEEIGPGDGAGLRRCVSRAYGVIFEMIEREQAMLRALLAEVMRDPGSDVGQFLVTRYLPSVGVHIMPWIASHMERGVIRPLPLLIAGQQFVAPVVMHVATRPFAGASGLSDLPAPPDVCDQFADLFCRAVEVRAAERHGGVS